MQKQNETKKGDVTMRGKYLNPKADMTFKLVFGEHPDLVMSLLNALLPLPEDGQIESVEYLTPEMVPENPAKKDSIVDARTSRGASSLLRCSSTGTRSSSAVCCSMRQRLSYAN